MILPVILSGGSGTRLWPLSTNERPKQFLSLLGEKSLFQETVSRANGLPKVLDPLVICNDNHRFLVAEQLQGIKSDHSAIILEPIGRNTAPAIAIAAMQAMLDGEDPVLLVLPSDHIIGNRKEFYKAVKMAQSYAEKDKLITFGIVPTKPETGYGYIKAGRFLKDAYVVSSFVEKPNLKLAEKYLKKGNYYWNSGMFMFRASVFLQEMAQHAPDILKSCKAAFKKKNVGPDFIRLNKNIFSKCRSDSIDYAVMEKTADAVVVPLDASWSDVGSWLSLHEICKKDKYGNVNIGNVLTKDVKDSYLRSEGRLVAAVGVENIIIIETDDAVLVADKHRSQEVKEIVEKLKKRKQ